MEKKKGNVQEKMNREAENYPAKTSKASNFQRDSQRPKEPSLSCGDTLTFKIPNRPT